MLISDDQIPDSCLLKLDFCEQGRSHMQYSIKTHRQLLAQGAKDDKKSLERAGILDYRDCWNGARHRLFIRSQVISRTRLTSWVRTAGLTQVPLKTWGWYLFSLLSQVNMDHSDASTASFGNAALAADRVSASMNTSPETIEEDPPEVRRPATTTRTRSRSPSEPSTPPRRSPRSDNSPRETRRRTSLGPERIPALEDGTMVPVPSDSETVGRVVGSNNLQVSQNVDTLSDQCASLLAEVQVLQQKETWAAECEHRQAEVIRHESQIHEVMTAHLQELYSVSNLKMTIGRGGF